MDIDRPVSDSDTMLEIFQRIWAACREIIEKLRQIAARIVDYMMEFCDNESKNPELTAPAHTTYAECLKARCKAKYLRRMVRQKKRRKRRKPIHGKHKRKNRRNKEHEQERHGSHQDRNQSGRGGSRPSSDSGGKPQGKRPREAHKETPLCVSAAKNEY